MEEFPQIQVRTCSESDLHSQRTSLPHSSCVCLRRSQDSKYLGSCQVFKMAGMHKKWRNWTEEAVPMGPHFFFSHTLVCVCGGTCACLYECVHVDMRVCEHDEGVPTRGELPASASQTLGLKVCTTSRSAFFKNNLKKFHYFCSSFCVGVCMPQ